MSKAHVLVVAALCLLGGPGCDEGLPFQGKLCRQRSRVPLGATSVRLLDAERTTDATLVLWTANSEIGTNPLLLSVRTSVGFRTPIQLPGIWLDPRPHALSAHEALTVVPAPRSELAEDASGTDAGVPVRGEVTLSVARIDSGCLEHRSDVLSAHPSAQLALGSDGRSALAWADAGIVRARVVSASGKVHAQVVAEWEEAEAVPEASAEVELSQLVALRGGDFVAAFGPRSAGEALQLFTSRWARGAWQQPEEHAAGVEQVSLARLSDGGAALAWTRWDGMRATLQLRLSSADGEWRDAQQIHASTRRIEQLRLVASRRDARLAVAFRQGGSLLVRVLDDGVASGALGDIACDCALDDGQRTLALALDEQGGLVVVQPRPSAPAQVLRYDGLAFELVGTLGDAGSEVVEAKLAAAPDGRLTALYVQHERERIMASELTLGRPGSAAPIAER